MREVGDTLRRGARNGDGRLTIEPVVEPPLLRPAGFYPIISSDVLARIIAKKVPRECLAGWVIEGPGGAAKVLGLHPNTLRSRMKRRGISRPT